MAKLTDSINDNYGRFNIRLDDWSCIVWRRARQGYSKIAKGQNEIAKGQNEIVKGQNEIVKGQAEIIRILKERLPLPPASGSGAAAPDSGHGANAG